MNLIENKYRTIGLVFFILVFVLMSFKGKSQVTCSCNFDSDGDGIMNCFDKCPNTKNGISVDTHGCPRDTDWDGIPDYKDHELITPTECQPTDSNGIGYCEYNCSKKPFVIRDGFETSSVLFLPNRYNLEPYIIKFLESIALRMKVNPNFKMVIQSNCGQSKQQIQLAKKRIEIVIQYLTEHEQIDKERFIYKLVVGIISDFVILKGMQAGDEY